jgi:hypothetical protein
MEKNKCEINMIGRWSASMCNSLTKFFCENLHFKKQLGNSTASFLGVFAMK